MQISAARSVRCMEITLNAPAEHWYCCNPHFTRKETLTLNLIVTLTRKKNITLKTDPNISPDLSISTTLILTLTLFLTLTLLLTLTCHPRGWGRCLGLSLLAPNLRLHWRFTEILWGACQKNSLRCQLTPKARGKKEYPVRILKYALMGWVTMLWTLKKSALSHETEGKKSEI